MSNRINHRRDGRSRRPRRYAGRISKVEGFEHARSFAFPVDTDDEPETSRKLQELLGGRS